jgi:chromate transporter
LPTTEFTGRNIGHVADPHIPGRKEYIAIVDSYGWLTHEQMIDGFALVETTPDTVIRVPQFVGFHGGMEPPWGPYPRRERPTDRVDHNLLDHFPRFYFILLEAPSIEILRGNLDLTGALSTITAADVGVIMNLGIIPGWSVFRPDGWNRKFNEAAFTNSIAAFLALFRFPSKSSGFYSLGVCWASD